MNTDQKYRIVQSMALGFGLCIATAIGCTKAPILSPLPTLFPVPTLSPTLIPTPFPTPTPATLEIASTLPVLTLTCCTTPVPTPSPEPDDALVILTATTRAEFEQSSLFILLNGGRVDFKFPNSAIEGKVPVGQEAAFIAGDPFIALIYRTKIDPVTLVAPYGQHAVLAATLWNYNFD